jgi:tetratricopeptide (TPR) repeat protein
MIIADRDSADTWLTAQNLALDAARQAGDRYGEAITLDNLGIAHRHLYNLTTSQECFSAALTVFQEIGDQRGQARAANGLGVVRLFAHHIDQALACFEKALELARELDHRAFIGFFTRNLGWALLSRGDLEQAEPLLRQSAALLQASGESLEQAEALTLLAAVLRGSGRIEQARDVAERALAIAGEFDGTLFEALGLLELGRIELAQRDATEALAYLQQAAALFWRVGRPDLQAVAWDATGVAYLALKRVEEAVDFHRRAVATHRVRGDQWQLALSLANLADALTCGGDPQAREHRREAARLLAGYSDPPAAAKRAELDAALAGE